MGFDAEFYYRVDVPEEYQEPVREFLKSFRKQYSSDGYDDEEKNNMSGWMACRSMIDQEIIDEFEPIATTYGITFSIVYKNDYSEGEERLYIGPAEKYNLALDAWAKVIRSILALDRIDDDLAEKVIQDLRLDPSLRMITPSEMEKFDFVRVQK